MNNFEYPNKFQIRCSGIDAETQAYVVRYYEIFAASFVSLTASKKVILKSFKAYYNSPKVTSTIKVLKTKDL